jgi:hypothetical protein
MSAVNFDILMFIEILVKFTLVTHLIRYILTFLFPKELRNYFDNYAMGVRNQSIKYTDNYFPDTNNFEVVILSRVIVPLLFMLSINTYLDFFLANYVFGRYLLLGYFFYILKLYFFLNIAPSLDDLNLLYKASGISRIMYGCKILFIFFMYDNLTPFMIALIIVIPISDLLSPYNYQNINNEKSHPSWDFH